MSRTVGRTEPLRHDALQADLARVPEHGTLNPSRRVLPIRSDTRVKLVSAIARGRQWLSEIEAGAATIDGIAIREACSKRHVNMTISLAFLAPSKAAVEGRLPHGIGGRRKVIKHRLRDNAVLFICTRFRARS